MSESKLVKQAEEANTKELEDLRLKATQALLRERAEQKARYESMLDGIERNIKDVEKMTNIQSLKRIADNDKHY